MDARAAPPGPLPAGLARDDLVAEVRRALGALPDGAAALVAVSGGPDSSALTALACEARPDLRLTLGHVRHGLRADEDDLDAVRWHAAAFGLALRVDEVTVTTGDHGLEAAARARRYAALRRLARDAGAGWLLVGHTADDQAETVLLRLARGTGPTGLGAMAPVRGDLVRPLLRLRRDDVHRFVEREGLRSVRDPMNDDPGVRRVLARQRVLPALEALGPDPVGALARLADLARDDDHHLEAEAAARGGGLVRRYGPTRAVPRAPLLALDAALARRVLRGVVDEVRGGDPPTAAQVTAVLDLQPGQALDLPGCTATCGGGWIAVAPDGLTPGAPVPLEVPGRAPWRAAAVEVVAAAEGAEVAGGRHTQLTLAVGGPGWSPLSPSVDGALVPPGADPALGAVVLGGVGAGDRLTLRSREPGDRVATRAGSRKVQDLFVDAGVPRAERDLVPLVACGRRVLWVPGVAVDAEAADAGVERPEVHLALAPAPPPRPPEA